MKTLRSQTIVPNSLYVERRADKQLAQIISEMGRPGYVLVSRQMGKTNLLLHAKRKLQQSGDLFVYLDATNPFPDIRSFLRNIIDVTLDASGSRLENISSRIVGRRTASDLQPHKEHEWELREILRAIHGRLVIFVDEVDALSGVAYSDEVFSFFRSVFFSGRDNWTEFNRLNYILSGVAEPAEIIKNKAVSPFNIGERIYLDDFTKLEFEEFIAKTGLTLTTAIVDRIFYWANGNPRLSWDICSAVEDSLAADHDGNPLIVDDIVREVYFGSVDMPPVDHIKKLVEEHTDLRNALVAIHYGKSEGISDKMRTKLYLAGITVYDARARKVSIRNRVLEDALNENYLLTLSGDVRSTFDLAKSYFAGERYALAIDALKSYLEQSPQADTDEARYMLGVSWFREGDSAQAIETFNAIGSDLPQNLANACDYFAGMANMDEKRYGQAIEHYRAVVVRGLSEHDALFYFDAAVQLSKAIAVSVGPKAPEIASLSEMVIGSKEEVLRLIPGDSQRNGLLVAAYMNLAHHKEALQETNVALTLADEAAEFAHGYFQLAPLLMRFRLTRQQASRNKYLDACVQAIVEQSRSGKTQDFDAIPFELVDSLIDFLDGMARYGDVQTVVSMLLTRFLETSDVEELVFSLISGVFLAPGRLTLKRAIIATIFDVAIEKLTLNTKRMLAIIPVLADSEATGGAIHESNLASVFLSVTDLCPVGQERFALYKVIASDIKHRNLERAEALRAVISRISPSEMSGSRMESSVELLSEYLGCLIAAREERTDAAALAKSLVDRAVNMQSIELPSFPNDFIRLVRHNMTAIAARGRKAPIKREHAKVGRNKVVTVEYEDGPRSGKYKTFQDDLDKGICKLAVATA